MSFTLEASDISSIRAKQAEQKVAAKLFDYSINNANMDEEITRLFVAEKETDESKHTEGHYNYKGDCVAVQDTQVVFCEWCGQMFISIQSLGGHGQTCKALKTARAGGDKHADVKGMRKLRKIVAPYLENYEAWRFQNADPIPTE